MMDTNKYRWGLGLSLALLALVSLVSAGEVVVHVLQTGNITYIYTSDMSPKECISSCTLTYDDANCSTVNDTVIGKLTNITNQLNDVELEVVAMNSNLTGSIGALPSSQRIGEILDTQKSDLSTYLSTVITDKMTEQSGKLDTYFAQASDKATCDAASNQCALDLVASQNRATTAEADKMDAENHANDMTNVTYAAIILAVFMFAVSFNLLPMFKRQLKGG